MVVVHRGSRGRIPRAVAAGGCEPALLFVLVFFFTMFVAVPLTLERILEERQRRRRVVLVEDSGGVVLRPHREFPRLVEHRPGRRRLMRMGVL